jgi:hypothetical protein
VFSSLSLGLGGLSGRARMLEGFLHLTDYNTPAWRKRGLDALNWISMIWNYFSKALPETWECGINKYAPTLK